MLIEVVCVCRAVADSVTEGACVAVHVDVVEYGSEIDMVRVSLHRFDLAGALLDATCIEIPVETPLIKV
jgi:hypothetical protein